MARNRMIKPEFWEDEKIGTLSLPARLLFLACLNFADDEGLIRWNSSYLNACAFVYDNFSENKIKKIMNELEKSKILQVFETKNHFFIAKIRNFKKHQKIDHPQPTRFDIDLDLISKSEELKNQSEIGINSENSSENNSLKNSEQFAPKDNIIEVKDKEKLKEVKDKEYMSDFEKFWQIYPKQRAGSKEKAYKAFVKAITEKRTTIEKIINASQNYAVCEEVKKGFAKGCAAWLNDDRFNDNFFKKNTGSTAEDLVQKIANGDFNE